MTTASAIPSRSLTQFANTVARNSLWGLAAQFAIKLFSFAFSVLVLRHLGAAEYGQYAAVLAFGAMFTSLADLGVGQFVVREIARQRSLPNGEQLTRDLYANALALRLLLALLAAALLIAAAWFTGRPPAMVGAIALGTLGLIMYGIQGTNDAVLGGYERLDLASAARVLSQFIFICVGGLALWLGFGYYGLVFANLLGIAMITVVCWRAVRRIGVRPAPVQVRAWAAILRASIPFGVIGFTLGLSYKFDSVLLNITRSNEETGFYNAAYNLVFSAAILSNVFNTALFPSLTRRAAGSSRSLTTVYSRSLRYLLVASLPIAVGVCSVADRLIPLLYTSDYMESIPALRIVIWTVPLMFVSEFLGYVAVIQGREHFVARSVIVSTAVNILANLLLIPVYGLMAAAAMTVITEAVLASQYVWLLRDTLRLTTWKESLLGCSAASALLALLLLVSHEAPLALQIVVGALGYFGMILALRIVQPSEFAPMFRNRTEQSAALMTSTLPNAQDVVA